MKSKPVKINLAESAGFCFGVKRAINIAREAVRRYPRIEMLGDIVHNEAVASDIKKAGIKKVNRLKKSKDKVFLAPAHGTPLKIFKKAKSLGYTIIDATCPKVCQIHKIAGTMEKEARKIIIIGDKNHAEVKGIVGHLKTKPLIIEKEKDIKTQRIKKAAAVVQSTQNAEIVNKIFAGLRRHIKDLKLFNTICATTRQKQNDIRTLPLKNDVMIIIGSKTSANTKRLYEISKALNKKSYWVQSCVDLKNKWFKNAENVGITAGASTPDYTTRQVINRIKQLTAAS